MQPVSYTHLLDVHHMAGYIDVAALGADGVGLPVELLNEEVQLTSGGSSLLQHVPQLADVAAQDVYKRQVFLIYDIGLSRLIGAVMVRLRPGRGR